MNTSNNSTLVRQNRISKKRNVIGLYNSGRSISLNQLNTDYVNQLYKEQYFELKEQHEQTKRQLNEQQEQLKQLNYKLQRLLQEKKDFLSQFVHYSQVNTGCLVEDLELANLRLEKENRKWKDQLLLAQVRAASNYKNQLGKVMIINMKQQLQTNYDWVKARIDSGLNDRTKRSPSSGQLIRQRKMSRTMFNGNNSRKNLIDRTVNRSSIINRSINNKSTKLTNNRPTINKERHRVSFSNQLEQEHLYEDDFEQDDEEEEIIDDEECTLDSSSNEDEESKSSELETKNNSSNNRGIESDKLDNKLAKKIDTSDQIDKIDIVADIEGNFKQVKNQLKKAKNKIKKLGKIIYIQQQFIDRQQELANQTDQLDSLKTNYSNKKITDEKNLILDSFNEQTIETNLASTNLSSNSTSSLDSIESIQTAGGNLNELQISSNKIKKDQLISTNYRKNKKLNKKSTNDDYQIDTNGIDKSTEGELHQYIVQSNTGTSTNDRKTPESTKSSLISGDEETNSTISSFSLSSFEQLTLSVHVKHENEEQFLISNGVEQANLDEKISLDQNSKTKELLTNLSKQLQIEKIRNEQLENRNRGRLRELEQNINDLSKENEILRNSLDKCIKDCLTEISGNGL